ncbi:MAG: carbon-nitrogen hydrolase family protein [Chthoniobacterales bacterium]|nr:carbon-nitrogen hydrolase family protein [Chthoniobacterales bacterium]
MSDPISVAIIQSSPVLLDLEASMAKAIALTEEAARNGARLVTFGETWLPGYPAWLDYCSDVALWDHAPSKEVFARLRQNSVVVPGKETKRLAQLAGDHQLTLGIGVNERVETGPGNGTLYNSLLTFSPDGKLANHHRKLVPTYTERLIWGQGDGGGLESIETPFGRVGGLICWEHWMPLARQAMHNAGEHIHVAVWPMVHEMHQIASRHYAFEARCFVLASGLVMRVKDLPVGLSAASEAAVNPDGFLLRGGSAIIGPDGQYIVEPVYDEETIVTAELDLNAVDRERMTLDVSGHYSRPDIFHLQIRRPDPTSDRVTFDDAARPAISSE